MTFALNPLSSWGYLSLVPLILLSVTACRIVPPPCPHTLWWVRALEWWSDFGAWQQPRLDAWDGGVNWEVPSTCFRIRNLTWAFVWSSQHQRTVCGPWASTSHQTWSHIPLSVQHCPKGSIWARSWAHIFHYCCRMWTFHVPVVVPHICRVGSGAGWIAGWES